MIALPKRPYRVADQLAVVTSVRPSLAARATVADRRHAKVQDAIRAGEYSLPEPSGLSSIMQNGIVRNRCKFQETVLRAIRYRRRVIFGGTLLLALACVAIAQSRPDSPAVAAHIEKARTLAGKEWMTQEEFFCVTPVPNLSTDPLIEPLKIFDNVWALGSVSTTIYAITTSQGIVLIDAGFPEQVQTVLLPQLKRAGIDESKITYVFLGHGHTDHYGAARYLQDKYHTRVASTAADWDMMDPPAGSGQQARADAPRRDMILTDGEVVKLGDFPIRVVTIPGHTPGSVGYIFPVRDGEKRYMAGLYGGTVLLPRIAWNLDEYAKSLAKWAEASKKAGVEVQLQNHPHMLNLPDKLDRLQSRKPGGPNPFVVGNEAYVRYFQMIEECTLAQKQRIAENPKPASK